MPDVAETANAATGGWAVGGGVEAATVTVAMFDGDDSPAVLYAVR